MKLSSRRIIKAAELQAADELTEHSQVQSSPAADSAGDETLVTSLRFFVASKHQRLEEQVRKVREEVRREAEHALEQARMEARQILEQARIESEKLKAQQAQLGYQEGYAKGQDEGYKAGWTEGLAKAREEVRQEWSDQLQKLVDTIKEAAAARDQALERAEEDVLKLSLAVAEKIIRGRVSYDPAVTVNVVRAALERVNGTSRVKVRIHPSLLLAMEESKDELLAVKGIDEIEFIEDSRVKPGGCLIETDFGRIDGRLEGRLEAVAQALMEVMYGGD